MKYSRYLILLFLLIFFTTSFAQSNPEKDVRDSVHSYFERIAENSPIKTRYKNTECHVDSDSMMVRVIIDDCIKELCFTHDMTKHLYDDVRRFLPHEWRNYKLHIISGNLPLEELVPNFFRDDKRHYNQDRLLKKEYSGNPWVRNISRPYSISKGLEGIHIALWQSHGKYFKNSEKRWSWQRPNMFCTNEDLLSQTFVIPYIIPMLQNAGAVVFTPRERDWQNNEIIVDNDVDSNDGLYSESYNLATKNIHKWKTMNQTGFAKYKDIYETCDTPFIDGSSRYVQSTTIEGGNAYAQWTPSLPEGGRYAVYVCYRSYANSADDACYTVCHKGGTTKFKVNQKIGGGTWVYLGTFDFDTGLSKKACVILSNYSAKKSIISADAVRFGGGMGNVVPESENKDLPQSGLPRWAEAAKYSTFWYGMPYMIHTGGFGIDEYKNDISSRSKAINYISGGSMFNPSQKGLRVPFEATIAFHTDAGYHKNDSVFGSLAIYRTEFNEGKTGAGLDRYVSRDLASILLTNLKHDLRRYDWNIRQLWDRNYGEAREPMTPACILEMLSHQNFKDMKLAFNPHFKFDFCRSVYKSIVKFICTEHRKPYVIQPLPVREFSISLNENKGTAELSWKETKDVDEPSAKAAQYVVYTRVGNGGFDNGTLVSDNKWSVHLLDDVQYSFRITAVNQGGESFPSETLTAYKASDNKGTILIVNAFNRLDAPYIIDEDTRCGFDLDRDPGVQYGLFAGFCGRQKVFDKTKIGIESSDGLGYSGDEYEGKLIMGNTFDYPYVHGKAIKSLRNHSFTSCSVEAFEKSNVDTDGYFMIDIIYGVQKDINKQCTQLIERYRKTGGNVLVSGSNISDVLRSVDNGNVSVSEMIDDKQVTGVSGSNTSFEIYREMNEHCYPVPSPAVLQSGNKSFPMLTYSDGRVAGVASKKTQNSFDNKNGMYIIFGFPIECISEQSQINRLVKGVVRYFE